MVYDVRIVREPGRHLAVTRFHARPEEMAVKFGPAFGAVANHLATRGIPVAGPAVAYYTMGPEGFDVAAGFVVSEPFEGDGAVGPLQLPAVEVATTTHVGPYADLGKAYEALRAEARDHGLRVDESASMWEEYWTGPDVPEDQARTVVFWPLKPAQ